MPMAETNRLVQPPKSLRHSIDRMRSPFGLRITLVVLIACALAQTVHTRESSPALFESFLAVDGQFLDASKIASARNAFETLAHGASRCGVASTPSQDRARCVVDSIFASSELVTVAEPGNPGSSTVTSALVDHRGNCAALT